MYMQPHIQQTHKNRLIGANEHLFVHQRLRKSLLQLVEIWRKHVSKELTSSISILSLLEWSSRNIKDGLQYIDDTNTDAFFTELHNSLHNDLDELVADWVYHQKIRSSIMLSRNSVQVLLDWSEKEAENPTDVEHDYELLSDSEAEKRFEKEAFPPNYDPNKEY